MSAGQTCLNCSNLNKDNVEEPKCKAGCTDFLKQLVSGNTLTCKKWEEAVA